MAQKVYGKEGPTSYQEIAQDFHRMRSVVYVAAVCQTLQNLASKPSKDHVPGCITSSL